MYPDVPYVQLPGERVVSNAYVYGLSFCSHCGRAREFLTREGLSVQAILLDRLPAERRHQIQEDFQTAYGAKPIYPVLELDGELHFGFDADVWASLLQLDEE